MLTSCCDKLRIIKCVIQYKRSHHTTSSNNWAQSNKKVLVLVSKFTSSRIGKWRKWPFLEIIIITMGGIVVHFAGKKGEFGGLKCALACWIMQVKSENLINCIIILKLYSCIKVPMTSRKSVKSRTAHFGLYFWKTFLTIDNVA